MAGRLAARRACAMLGHPGAPVLAERGRPVYASGLRGSISHSAGAAAALAAPARVSEGIGVDIERRRLGLRALERVATAPERAWVLTVPATAARRDRLTALFSVKESAYKALASFGAAPPAWRAIDVEPTGATTFAAAFDGLVLQAARATVGPLILTWALLR